MSPDAGADADADASANADASAHADADADADAQADADGRDAGCRAPEFQPSGCAPPRPDLELGSDAIHAWFVARGLSDKEYYFEACRDVAFGAEAEHVLVCIVMTPIAIDMSMGIEGPVEHRFDLEVLAVRDKKRIVLMRVPFAFGVGDTVYDTATELLYSARFSIDASAGAIDLEAPAAECKEALATAGPYWKAHIAELRGVGMPAAFGRQLERAYNLEITSDIDRINATCHAAGHYTRGPDGRLVKSP